MKYNYFHWVAKIITFIIGMGPILYFYSIKKLQNSLLAEVGAILMGLLALLFFITIGYQLTLLVIKILSKLVSINYYRSLVITVEIAWLLVAVYYLFSSFQEGYRPPSVNSVRIAIPNFSYPNLKLVYLTDLHLGPLWKEKFTRHIAKEIKNIKPDILLLGGDVIELDPLFSPSLPLILQPFLEITAKIPSYMVLGNHEYYNNLLAIIDILPKYNIHLLKNEGLIIGTPPHAFNLLGVNDYSGVGLGEYAPNYKMAFRNRDPNLSTILLAHQPRCVADLEEKNKIDLILSGHTHNGQIFPFNLFVKLVQPYVVGLHKHFQNTQIYVSAGTGSWGPPIRFGSRNEITLIEIVSTK
ncbi:MAG: metallophosphoesterase [Oligoflexia bacterium]|nr:metallophosphoesterase [Oligoflexia bacterium]